MTDKLDLTSPDLVQQNIERIAALFPNCITETVNGKQIDFDLLRQELSPDIIEGTKERYRLEWPGKREAIVTANLPTTNTLRPVVEDSVDFDTTENLYIEGDNLEVLKLLQESYLSKVKMIYIDPPYNTGNDFVYKDNFTQNTEEYKTESGLVDEYNQRMVANPDTSGRYHSDWLTMMYPRLKLARNLLTDDGVIFISIDDNEVHNLRKICDEVFGEGNLRNTFTLRRYDKNLNRQFIESGLQSYNVGFEYVLCYSKSNLFNFYPVYKESSEERQNTGYWKGFWNDADRSTMRYEILGFTPLSGQWKWKKEAAIEAIKNYEVFVNSFSSQMTIEEYWILTGKSKKFIRRNMNGQGKNKGVENWIPPATGILRNTNWTDLFASKLDKTSQGLFDYPKNKEVIEILINTCCNESDIILDFFSGSATTAHAVMQLNAGEDVGNRKFIMVQLPEATDQKNEAYKAGYKNICEIGKERIRRAGKKILEEQATQQAKKAQEIDFEANTSQATKLDVGFRVYRLDSSNMQDVYYRPKEYSQASIGFLADNIKPDRTAQDLVAQIMLDWGLPLSLSIERASISGKEVFKIAGNALFACFDSGIDEDFARAIALEKPLRVVFRDASFAGDTAKENVKQLLKQLSADTEMRVI